MSNAEPALKAGLEHLHAARSEIVRIHAHAEGVLADIEPLLIGCRIERWGHTYEIVGADLGLGGHVNLSGVRVGKKGPGTRQFDLGFLRPDDQLWRPE